MARAARRCSRTKLVVLFAVLPGLTAACATAPSQPGVIWERGDQIVRLAPQDTAGAPPNDHPVVVAQDEIATMLTSLNMRFVDEGPEVAPIAVFTREEIGNLSAALATGLGGASPAEDIEFHMIGSRRTSPGAFTKRNRVTAGRAFYREGNINIIFGQVQTALRKRNLYGRRDQDFIPRNYGSRESMTVHPVDLQSTAAVGFHRDDAGIRKDWLIMDPHAAVAATDAEPLDEQPAVIDTAPAAAAATGVAAAGASAASSEAAATGAAVGQAPEPTELERRLAELKRLFEAGLISEAAYQDRMQEILQDL